jgi:hypothetical protein
MNNQPISGIAETTISHQDIGVSTEDFLKTINRFALIYGAEITCVDGKCTMKKTEADQFLWLKGKGVSAVSSEDRMATIQRSIELNEALSASENNSFSCSSWRGLERFAQDNFQPSR